MTTKINCEYYEQVKVETNETGYRTYDQSKPTFEHGCNYRFRHEGLPKAYSSDICDTNHDFCPYNPKNKKI